MQIKPSSIAAHFAAMVLISGAHLCRAAETGGLPAYLADRGDGIPTSLLGTYIREKEFIFYPFYEYTRTGKFEYSPRELGVPVAGDPEFFGKLVEREALLFFAYAFSDSLALEFESAVHSSAEFTRAPGDNTGTPDRLRESGLGDTEINLRWRYAKETATRPEITYFFQTVFPLQKKKRLLGTQDWEFESGVVATKGYSFGTLSYKLSVAYDRAERKAELSEWAIDYLKRINSKWRVALSLEGDQLDELSLIGELQYSLGKNAVLKLNTGVGLVKKAPDFAPEIGVLFRY
jgi:hypothetical protein